MLEKEFAQRYIVSQENTHAPADLVESMRELMEHAQADDSMRADTTERRRPFARTSTAPGRRSTRPSVQAQHESPRRTKRHRWMMPVAACLAALLVLFGVGSAVLPFTQQEPGARAYARTPNLLTAGLDSGVIPFAFDERLIYQSGGAPWSDGFFTAMQFTVGAENVSRIQATISRGELCLVTTETLERCSSQEDPVQAAKLDEALDWRLANRGTGTYFADYDYVACAPRTYDYETLNEYDGPFDVRLIKRMGSTIDVPYEGEPLTFCFWYGNDDITFYNDSNVPQLVALNGDELTLTTQFDDDTFRTQTIEIHDGWFAWNNDYDLVGTLESVEARGPFKTLRDCKRAVDSSDPPYRYMEDTLFGVVTSITDDPHPYPLDGANAQLNEPVEPHIVTLEDMLGPAASVLTIEGAPSERHVRSIEGSFAIGQWSYERDGWADLRWSDMSAYITDELPANIALDECQELISFQGDLDYMNRCRMATSKWSVNRSSVVSDGNSFVVLDTTVTNAESEPVLFSSKDLRGDLCTVDKENGTILIATGGVFGAKDDQGRLWGWSTTEPSIRLEPDESTRLRIVFIADNQIAEAEEVLFTVDRLYYSDNRPDLNQGFLAKAEFISLGKLERR